jgi:hypothetical protein
MAYKIFPTGMSNLDASIVSIFADDGSNSGYITVAQLLAQIPNTAVVAAQSAATAAATAAAAAQTTATSAATTATNAASVAAAAVATANAALPLAGGTMTGQITTAGNPTSALHVSNKQYTDAADTTNATATAAAATIASAALPKAGGTMTGQIVTVGNPTSALHVSNKQYTDAADTTNAAAAAAAQTTASAALPLAGGTMTGTITAPTAVIAYNTSTQIYDISRPAAYYATTFEDANQNVAGAFLVDGTLWWAKARLVNVTVTGSISLGSNATAGSLTPTLLNLGAGVMQPILSLFGPNYQPLASWEDSAGNIAGAVMADGSFHFANAYATNLNVTNISITGPFAPASVVVGSQTTQAVTGLLPNIVTTQAEDTSGNIARFIAPNGRAVSAVADPAYLAANKAKPSQMATVSSPISAGGQFGSTVATVGTTLSSLWSLEDDFDWVRLVFLNDKVLNWGIQAAAVAVTAAPGDYVTPSVGGTAWTPVTFNNAGLNKPYNAQNSGSTTSLLNLGASFPPPPLSSNSFSLICSDWVPIRSIPRTDGGVFPLLMARAYLTSVGSVTTRGVTLQGTTASEIGGGTGAYGAADFIGGRKFTTYAATGDYTSTNQSGFPVPTPGSAPFTVGNPCMVQVMLRSGRTITVMNVGDSIHGGTGGFLNIGWMQKAVWGITKPVGTGMSVHLCNLAAWPGGRQLDYTLAAEVLLPIVQPQILITETWSRNVGSNDPWLWAANTVYPVGSLVTDSNNSVQQSGPLYSLPGTSGASAPTWATTIGGTTTDNTITWTCLTFNPANWFASTVYAAGVLKLDSNSNVQKCTTGGTTGASAPTWATTLNATTTDNGVVWQLIQIGGATPYTLPDANNQLRAAMDLAFNAQQQGAVPILICPVPGLTQSASLQAAEPFRVAVRASVLRLGLSNTVIMDTEAFLGQSTVASPISPNPMIAALSLAGAGVHPNDFGHALIAQCLTPKLRAMIEV